MCSERLAVVTDISESGTESFHGLDKERGFNGFNMCTPICTCACTHPDVHVIHITHTCIYMPITHSSCLSPCLCVHICAHHAFMHWLLLGNTGMTRGHLMTWNHAQILNFLHLGS